MRRVILKAIAALGVAALTLGAVGGAASAKSLLEKIKAGETIRIGFSNEIPWAYPGDGNKPLGFVNAFALGVLPQAACGVVLQERSLASAGALGSSRRSRSSATKRKMRR